MKGTLWAVTFAALLSNGVLYAHGGGLDRNGGHYNRKTGVYHCHRCPCGCEGATTSGGSTGARARPASPSGEARVQQAWNPDVKVWVNMNSGVYHCPGTRWYGKTKQGKYMIQKEAQEQGHRPAYGKVCR